jgi:hypothetical protein
VTVRRRLAPAIAGLAGEGRRALLLVARLHALHGSGVTYAALPTEFLHALAKDPPASDGPRLGAAVAVRTFRDALESGGAPRWPASVDPEDPELRDAGLLIAALAMVSLTSRTGVGVPELDPDARPVLAEWPGDADLVECFTQSEQEILDRKRKVVPYPVEEFLRDLHEVPARLKRKGRILPPEDAPSRAGMYRFRPNHDDRVVRLYDFFRDKYGSPRGDRRADIYLAVLGFVAAHREGLERAGEIAGGPGGKGLVFRRDFLEDLLAHPVGWFEGRS